jgi:hypothetical protein
MAHRVAAAISRRWPPRAALAGTLLLAGCAYDQETTLARSARLRELQQARSDRRAQEEELARLRQGEAELAAAITAANGAVVRSMAALRSAEVQARLQADAAAAAERTLATALERTLQVERELAPLRRIEALLRDQEGLRAAAESRLQELTAAVAAVQLRVAQQEAELAPRLALLQQQLAAGKQFAAAVAAAEQAIGAALAGIAPPPAPAPAAAPAAATTPLLPGAGLALAHGHSWWNISPAGRSMRSKVWAPNRSRCAWVRFCGSCARRYESK